MHHTFTPAIVDGCCREQERIRKAEQARLETERILREQQVGRGGCCLGMGGCCLGMGC